MDQQALLGLTLNTRTRIEIKQRQEKFYAVLSLDNQTLGISETFNTYEAANLAGYVLFERYKNNLQSGSVF